ncbi:ATP-binding protein [Flexithrix dorotheae]|uniref:ATP-binding protein n=1 Tax=Flexithrix dorotheae TaxID=70993 RepID=UPI0003636D77|nr:ATP-binding protein [Flexithrix dorotheae]
MDNKYNVLYVDDELGNLQSFKGIFRFTYKVFTSQSAKEGLELLEKNQIHIVITDQRMPEMTGLKFLEEAIKISPDCIRIIATGFNDINVVMDAVNKCGIYRYISKPWNIEELKIILLQATELYNLRQKNAHLITELQQVNSSLENKVARQVEKITEQNLELIELNNEIQTQNEELYTQNEELDATIQNLRLTQARLVQSEKMISLGILTAGIAHEINNPINFITSGVAGLKKELQNVFSLLEKYRELDISNFESVLPAIKRYERQIYFGDKFQLLMKVMGNIEVGAKRTKEIVKGLTSFSGNEDRVISNFNICEGIDTTLLLISYLLKDKITVEKDYQKIPRIQASPDKLNQVWMNILINAIEAIGEEGHIRIKVYCLENQIIIAIKDTGKGMSKEVYDQAFVPFFTTKEVGKGIGLGLFISQNIVEDHGGKIQVESDEGKGSEFNISFPLINGSGPYKGKV